jgi:hypothetical protein
MAVGTKEGQRTGTAAPGQYLADDAPGFVVQFDRMHLDQRASAQRFAIAEAVGDGAVVVQHGAVQCGNEDVVVERAEKVGKVVFALAGFLFGTHARYRLGELPRQGLECGDGGCRDRCQGAAGQVEAGHAVALDHNRQYHQGADSLSDDLRSADQLGPVAMRLGIATAAGQLSGAYRRGLRGFGRQVTGCGNESRRQALMQEQGVAAVGVRPVKTTAVEARQAQGAVEDGPEQGFAIRVVEQDPGEIVLDLQQRFGVLALADVGNGAGAAPDSAVLATFQSPSAHIHPHPAAVVAADTVFGVEARRRGGKLPDHALTVLGVHIRRPVLKSGFDQRRCQADAGYEGAIVGKQAGDVVAFPCADPGVLEQVIDPGVGVDGRG